MGIAAGAMRAAENQMSATAGRIIRLTTVAPAAPVAPVEATQPGGYQPAHGAMPTRGLAEEIVNLKQAELGFRAGAAVFKAANRMTKRTLDLLV